MNPLLKLTGLHKSFGGIHATDDVNLEVLEGEVHAIIGPNGAGKTTLVQQIAGALQPSSGQISFDGHSMLGVPMHGRVIRGLARSYQLVSLFKGFTVLDNIALAIQAKDGSSMRFWNPVNSENKLVARAKEVLDHIGLLSYAYKRTEELGYAEQRLLEIGIAFATTPRMLLLDEPLAGVSGDESERIVQLVLKLKGAVTILLIEHDMSAVFRVADRISCLVQGHIIATGTPDEIRANSEVKVAYLGEEALS